MFTADDGYRQAIYTTAGYFEAAVKKIDEQFGEGYAEEYPQLIAAFMNTCAMDFHDATLIHKNRW